MPEPRTAADPMPTLRRRTSEKWRAHPADVLPMFVAEMDYPLAPAIRAALAEAIELGDTGYISGDDRGAAEAFAGFAAARWGWAAEPERMRTTTDVSVVIVESLRRLIAPGDGVIITPPVYPPFWDLIPEAGGRVVEVPLADDGARYELDLRAIDVAFAAGARAILLCNPHNPVGLVHERETLERLSQIVERHGAAVLSDEIHAPLTHRGVDFTPYLSVSDAAREHGIAAESASKAFNLAGLKAALFVTASDRMSSLVRALPDEVQFRTGLFGLMATRVGFADSVDWLDATIAAVEHNVELLQTELAARVPAIRMHAPRAGYLAWLDCTATGLGDDPAAALLQRGRLALSGGPAFGAQGRGFARINLACSPETVLDAVGRIQRSVAG